MRLKISYAILFLTLCGLSFAQYYKNIDSLKLKKNDKTLNDSLRIRVYRVICDHYFNNSEYDSIIKYGTQGLTIAREVRKPYWEINLLNMVGIAYWNKGDYDKAIFHYKQGLEKVNETGITRSLSNLYNNMGLAYWNKSDLPKALELYLKSLEIDTKRKNKEGMSSTMLNIGLVYADMGNFKSALQYYTRSLAMCNEIGDLQGKLDNYINIGQLHEKLGDHNKSMEYDLKALKVCEQVGDKKSYALVYNNLGSLHSAKLQHELSLKYYELSLANFKSLGDIAGEVMVENNIGSALNNLRKHKEAIAVLDSALKKGQEFDLKAEEIKTRINLAEAYSSLKDYKRSLENYVISIKLKDTIAELKNASLINQMQKEMEIKDTEAEFTIQKERELAAKDAEKQKQFYLIVSIAIVLITTLIFTFLLFKRFKLTNQQKKVIETQKHLVEEKQQEILDSIHYAKRIQNVLIANSKFISEHLPQNFIYFNPKDIVSGDFYWATLHNHKFYLAICDSTGHGVPGGFMSLLNMGFLSEAINEKDIEQPGDILNYVRQRLINTISSEGQKDGMDGILLCYDKKKNTYEYAAANNEPILIRDGKIICLEKDKMPVGEGERKESFSNHLLDLKPGDHLFLYTDGFADQFGGPKGKKFKYKQLNELLQNLASLPMSEQRNVLERTFNEWKGNLEQVDDVLIAGIKI